jgi:two-component system chemotaxis sensor kinase CheA
MERTYTDAETGQDKPDRRKNISDRRSRDLASIEAGEGEVENERRHEGPERRTSKESAFNIVVVNAGEVNYGLIVDNLLDSEEIVVKPLGRHLRGINTYAGATILGDGKAALILDVMGLSNVMNLRNVKDKIRETDVLHKVDKAKDAQSLLLVHNAPQEQFAIPLGLVSRIEKINKSDIEITSGKQTIKYRGGSLLLCEIESVANVNPRADVEHPFVIIFPFAGKEVGILVSQIIDVIDSSFNIDEETFRQPGVLGSAIIMDTTTLLLDLYGIISALMPEWVAEQKAVLDHSSDSQATLLIVEDSSFFLNQIKGFVEDAGYTVVTAMDGIEGVEAMENPENKIDLILTDIEMPNLDGVEMTERLRVQDRFTSIPIVALTSVAGDLAEQRALEAGIDEYIIKLDREKVLERVKYYLENGRPI